MKLDKLTAKAGRIALRRSSGRSSGRWITVNLALLAFRHLPADQGKRLRALADELSRQPRHVKRLDEIRRIVGDLLAKARTFGARMSDRMLTERAARRTAERVRQRMAQEMERERRDEIRIAGWRDLIEARA